ncbi:MAG: type II toxin-antitoxin system HicA family toxin [Solirubrobacterales bacterium]|nr:type II toxin-antitoxin system HicA family toxin [Solirubrobacterales bacterium]
MKRRDLERHLRAHGAQPLREGSRHAIWAVGGSGSERIAAVPRHREIKPGTVRAICADLEIPPPKGR